MKTTKIMIWVACLAMILGLFVVGYSQEEKEVLRKYEAVTGGGEVETKDEVVVRETIIIERSTETTLVGIQGAIDYYQMYVDHYEAQVKQLKETIAELEKAKSEIEKQASTVELKPKASVSM